MMQIRTFLPQEPHLKLQALQGWSRLRQDQLREAILVTRDAVTDFIKRQAARGDWAAIEQVLKGKPMTKAGRFLLTELRGQVVASLILRLGLRRVIAIGLAAILLPLILAKIAQQVITRVKRQPAEPHQ
ncbi:hypothetical protein I2I11_10000 [Pontibacter sp. 172403-2]|uniref:hypothetical protein n=1 Tax=Pontibacter rufus TaxID=2791028 RepID=UPI0018AF6680|nr:hypothetical protein [Pontibacter sp. 172403-2]MBF9253624.1 hypothetical protein [Pontibacter sp. 172403-2]